MYKTPNNLIWLIFQWGSHFAFIVSNEYVNKHTFLKGDIRDINHIIHP